MRDETSHRTPPAPVTLEWPDRDVPGVRLEPLSLDHFDDLVLIARDRDLFRWSPAPDGTPEGLRRYIEEAIIMRDAGTALPFATIDRASGRAIGSTRYAAIDLDHRRLEIGWTWIGRDHHGTHVNLQVKLLQLEHAFETLGFERVEFKTHALNARSRGALLKIGVKEEGTLRHHMLMPDGSWRDSVYFSVLREEWQDVRRRIEARLAARMP